MKICILILHYVDSRIRACRCQAPAKGQVAEAWCEMTHKANLEADICGRTDVDSVLKGVRSQRRRGVVVRHILFTGVTCM